MCSALCTSVSWSLGWGGPTAEFTGAPVPKVALFEILPVEGAAWFGLCQLGDLMALVDPTGLKAAAVLTPATPGLLEPGLSRVSDVLSGEAPEEATDC